MGASPYSTVQTQRNQAELSSSGVISWQVPQLCWAWAGALSDSRGMEQSQLSTKAQNPARTISLEMLDYMSLSQDTSEGSFESNFGFPPVSFIAKIFGFIWFLIMVVNMQIILSYLSVYEISFCI